jgi:hypothetical protein
MAEEERLKKQLDDAQKEIDKLNADAARFKDIKEGLEKQITEMGDQHQVPVDKKTVYVTRERKISKFAGRPRNEHDLDVDDWLADINQYIADLNESQKLDTILSHLVGEAKDEVKLLPDEDKDTSVKILSFLKKTFKSVESIVNLTQQLSNRVQKDDESVQSYSLSLLKLQQRINRKEAGVAPDEMVKSRFLEGIQNDALKRDLKKLAKANSRLTFSDLRKLVLTEIQDDIAAQPKVIKAKSAETKVTLTTEQQLLKQMELMNQTMLTFQQQQLEMMSKLCVAGVSNPSFRQESQGTNKKSDYVQTSTSAGAGRVSKPRKGPCEFCGKLGHVIGECWKKKNRDKRNANQQSVVHSQSTESTTQQGNASHPLK